MGDELWSCRVKIYDSDNRSPISECDVVVSFSELTLQNDAGLRIHGLKLNEMAELKRAFVSAAIEDVLRERFAFSGCEKGPIKPIHASTPPRTFSVKASNGALVWIDQ